MTQIQMQILLLLLAITSALALPNDADWLLQPISDPSTRATVTATATTLTISNNLVSRIFSLPATVAAAAAHTDGGYPAFATLDLRGLTTTPPRSVLRSLSPEARVTLGNASYAVGGFRPWNDTCARPTARG